MIQYTNIKRYDNLEFGQYLKLKGYSHSYLKSEINGVTPEFRVTDKVIIGKLVDAILTDPANAEMLNPLYPIAKSIAFKIKQCFGIEIEKFEKQVSYTANIVYNGFVMPTTGRLDFLIPKHAVVDLKVTHAPDVHALIEFMGYRNQLFNYCQMAEVCRQYILIYSVPKKSTYLIDLGLVGNENEFWQNKVLKFGNVYESTIL
jgi:hypothetical protein